MPADTVTIPKAEHDALLAQNQENTELIHELAEKVNALQTAVLAGVGIDPIIAARQQLGSVLVQFNRHYHRAAKPSLTQDGALVHESYAVSKGDVVRLRDDEFQRLSGEFPGLLESKKSKFFPKKAFDAVPDVDSRGHNYFRRVVRDIPVEELIKLAPAVG